ncbi:MAG TPA: MFS transporter [Bacteroidia bacterium]|nr:MFS transporter [Bacteroidia bacterium]
MNMEAEKKPKKIFSAAMFRALKHKNYRLFFAGQTISLIGTWMQQIAMNWLVYRLTNSVFLLGTVGFATQMSTFVLAPFAGVYTDRWNRHKILITTQSLSLLQALIFTILIFTHTIAVWHIFVLAVFLGFVNAFDIPARQAFLVQMIDDRKDLPNAIALNSSVFNAARLVGPAVAGILIALLGEGFCFLLNSVSYVAVIIALLMMKNFQPQGKANSKKVWEHLREGFSYAFHLPTVRNILILLAIISLFGMPYSVLMPVFAKKIFLGGAHTYGFLTGATGIGALIAAFFLAARKDAIGLGKILFIGSLIFGTSILLFSLSHNLVLSLFILVAIGFGQIVQMASGNTIIQTQVDDSMRGRIMSIYTMAFRGFMPLGCLLAGTLATLIGAPYTLFLGSTVCIFAGLLLRKKLTAIG